MNIFLSSQINQNIINECRDEKNNASSLYTGSLIMSYIQFHLTPRWNSLKTSCNQLQHTTVRELYKNNTTKAEKPYFNTPYTPRNHIKE